MEELRAGQGKGGPGGEKGKGGNKGGGKGGWKGGAKGGQGKGGKGAGLFGMLSDLVGEPTTSQDWWQSGAGEWAGVYQLEEAAPQQQQPQQQGNRFRATTFNSFSSLEDEEEDEDEGEGLMLFEPEGEDVEEEEHDEDEEGKEGWLKQQGSPRTRKKQKMRRVPRNRWKKARRRGEEEEEEKVAREAKRGVEEEEEGKGACEAKRGAEGEGQEDSPFRAVSGWQDPDPADGEVPRKWWPKGNRIPCRRRGDASALTMAVLPKHGCREDTCFGAAAAGRGAGDELGPIFVRPLDEEDVPSTPELNPIEYRKVVNSGTNQGWTCFRAVPDSGAQRSVSPKAMATG